MSNKVEKLLDQMLINTKITAKELISSGIDWKVTENGIYVLCDNGHHHYLINDADISNDGKHKKILNEQNDNFIHNSHYILSNKVRTNAFSSPILAKSPSPKNISPLSSENIIDFQTRIGATPTFFEPIVYKCCEPFQLDS